MELKILKPKQALNKAFLKLKAHRAQIDVFKTNLITLLARTNSSETEEFHKNLVIDFLKKVYYDPNHFINTKGKNDLVIHNGQTAESSVGVIIEAKKPTNKLEMVTTNKINVKAFQELVLYYLRERITAKNLEIKQLIITNINEWFVFDVSVFERLFAQNKKLVEQFTDFENGRLADTKTDFFYKQIAEPFIDEIKEEVEFTHFNIQDYQKPLQSEDKEDDNLLIALCKLLSPEHLLKLPFANDSNSLDKNFYYELLHILGLTETSDGSKKLIERNKIDARHSGTILEDAIIQLDSLDKLSRLKQPNQFGKTQEERLFNVALELSITWINRILFLKLLEGQLISYHDGDKSYAFLNLEKIKNYDQLNSLFFQVLARKDEDRNQDVKKAFEKVPFLNSSLFEPTELEQITFFINNLKSDKTIPILPTTVLKNEQGKKRTGNLATLAYLFDFLNAYDFASDGNGVIQEDNKTLINAAVLGLIFEKINGYKDGSFFTPGFITMYMCRQTIRKAVVQKFKEYALSNHFQDVKIYSIEDIYTLIPKKISKKEANQVLNSLKICDPAVGSGHFLVSALNEIIAVKNDLKILEDRNGKSLHRYEVEVVNDELVIIDEAGELFEYKPKNKESQRVQETFFHEKQNIIENCLFGVDINPNSVKICRLRLWIELLKNAYYKNDLSQGLNRGLGELETLPNIDINIKCGNSLVSRFAIDSDIKQALKKSKWTIESYRLAVATYRNAINKEQKREMVRLIESIKSDFSTEISKNEPKLNKKRKLEGELFTLLNQTSVFGQTEKEKKEQAKKAEQLAAEIQKIDTELEDIKDNKIYDNAFEWRFEFPEVLNEEGDFMGFDVVVGNPPYIRQEEFSTLKPYLKSRFSIYHAIADLLTYFVELSYDLLKIDGAFQFVISNKFTRANYGQVMRKFLLDKTTLTHFIDFNGIPVFDEATVDAAILGFEKRITKENNFIYANIPKENLDIRNFNSFCKTVQNDFYQQNLNENAWAFETKEASAIKSKIERQGTVLKNWHISIFRGILTGFNEAFVIDSKKKDELIAQDPKSAEVLKPMLRGRDIQKWKVHFQDLWLINTHNGIKQKNISRIEVEKEYPAIFQHLKQFENQLVKRTDKGDNWDNLRNCAYLQDFSKPKIIYKDISQKLTFALDKEGYFMNNTCYFMKNKNTDLSYLLANLNSKLFDFYYRLISTQLGESAVRMFSQFVEQIPIKIVSQEQEKPFVNLVNKILKLKTKNPSADTSNLENQIDQLVYQLYELTEEEIKIIEKSS